MTRRFYCILLTFMFTMVTIPGLINVIFDTSFLRNHLNISLIKTIMVLLIAFSEAYYINSKLGRTLGFIFALLLVFGLLFKIMHWPYGSETFYCAAIAVVLNTIIFLFLEKNKNAFHFLLLVYMVLRLGIIFRFSFSYLWNIELGLSLLIMLVGVRGIFTKNN